MPNSKNYIEEFGGVSFAERPFCDADALALCEVFYMPLELVVSSSFDAEPVNFSDACNELFDIRGNKHAALGLMITKTPSIRLMQMAASERFSEIKVVAVNEVYSKEPAIQYCAGTFLLPGGDIVIVYRGTDDSIAGWKEDLDMMVRQGTPAYDLALDYFSKAAEKFSGNIYVCGHSKGGNIALRTAIKCPDEIRKRIVSVYNYDGPGYYNFHLFNTPAYAELLPGYKHFVPSSSLIGMMLCHDYDYKAVKSSRLTGAFQHDLGTWQIKDGELVIAPDISLMAKLTDAWLAGMVDGLSTVSSAAMDKVVTAITEGTGVETLYALVHNFRSAVGGAVEAYRNIDPETKAAFKEAFNGAGKLLIDSFKAVRDHTFNRAAEIVLEKI